MNPFRLPMVQRHRVLHARSGRGCGRTLCPAGPRCTRSFYKWIDNVELELLKLAVLRNVNGAPLADETELRVVDADEVTLTLTWVISHTGKRLSSLEVDRSNLVEIATNADACGVVTG